jgi:hypothetical protein
VVYVQSHQVNTGRGARSPSSAADQIDEDRRVEPPAPGEADAVGGFEPATEVIDDVVEGACGTHRATSRTDFR